jgi:hypothetical protein
MSLTPQRYDLLYIYVYSNFTNTFTQVAVRAKLEKQKEERRAAKAAVNGNAGETKKPSALDRFKRAS